MNEEPGIRPLEPARAFESPFHSQGILVTGGGPIAFVSGQAGVRPDGSVGDGVAEQTRIAMTNIGRILAEGELSFADIASLRIYLTAHEHIGLFVESAKPFLRGHRPAATLLVLEHLSNPALLVQIEAVAVARR